MKERVLTVRELNRALLARQLLLRRRRLGVTEAVERLAGLQAQWPPSPFVALWSRLDSFRHEQLVRALRSRRVVKATLMRETLHHVSARDYLAYAGLFTTARLAGLERRAAALGLHADVTRLAALVAERTSAEPRSRPELVEELGLPKLRTDDPSSYVLWHLLATRIPLLHSPEASLWRHNTAGGKFVPARVWLGADPEGGEAAAAHLVRRYLAAFGPAARADIGQWTGLPLATLEPALARLPLRRFRDEAGRKLVDLPRAPLPPGGSEAPPRFLPMWDSALLAHADRSRILPPAYRAGVIAKNGDIAQTFLLDGFVAGTWRLEDNRIGLEPFEPIPAGRRAYLEREAAALAAFHGLT